MPYCIDRNVVRLHDCSLGLFVLIVSAILPGNAMSQTTTQRTNFILFIADDMAWDDCGAYGHPKIRTPNIDRLAERGTRFDNAFLTCSSCSPSRSSIITGRYPHNTGARQLHQPLSGDQVTRSVLDDGMTGVVARTTVHLLE